MFDIDVLIKQKTNWTYFVAGITLLCLTVLCVCFPAQYQFIKIPFLAVVCLVGTVILLTQKGKNISSQTWVWFGGYLLYNTVWSVIGMVNQQPGVGDYFRLGVIWTFIFLFVISAIDKKNIIWIYRALAVCLAFEVVAIFILLGYAFQIWPNLLQNLFPSSAVGIHMGYTQVTGHFIGGIAFTAPAVYCYFIQKEKQSKKHLWLLAILWLFVVFAIIATSRRILLVIIPVCVMMTVVVALMRPKEKRKAAVRKSLFGLVITALFMLISIWGVSSMASSFLINHRTAVIKIAKQEYKMDGNIRYTNNLVFDPYGIPDPNVQNPDDNPSGQPSVPGFGDRIEEAMGQLTEESVRSNILRSALNNWKYNPIIGAGFGAELPGYSSFHGNGIYEMEYVVRLYTTGILGLLILIGLLGWVGIAALRIMVKNKGCISFLAPIMIAYLGALIATATNPYIFSGFDFLIMLFLPVAVLNCAWKERSKDKTDKLEAKDI